MTTRGPRVAVGCGQGFVTAWTAGLLVALIGLVGMVSDAGWVLRTRSHAFGTAAAAARVGAQQLDESAAVATGELRLDPDAAEAAAEAYLGDHGVSGSAEVVSDVDIEVTVSGKADLRILPGSVSYEVAATATAREPTASRSSSIPPSSAGGPG